LAGTDAVPRAAGANSSVHTASSFAAGAALTASLCGVKPDLFAAAAFAGPVRALALSQFTTSALTLATLVRAAHAPRRPVPSAAAQR
jgi:hypothetical protein